jgi:hypothetical protein
MPAFLAAFVAFPGVIKSAMTSPGSEESFLPSQDELKDFFGSGWRLQAQLVRPLACKLAVSRRLLFQLGLELRVLSLAAIRSNWSACSRYSAIIFTAGAHLEQEVTCL